MSKEELDKFHYHEALDRASMLSDMVDTYLMSHPAIEAHPEIKEKVEWAFRNLYDAYQQVSAAGHAAFPIEPATAEPVKESFTAEKMDAVLHKMMQVMIDGGAIKVTYHPPEEVFENPTHPSADTGMRVVGLVQGEKHRIDGSCSQARLNCLLPQGTELVTKASADLAIAAAREEGRRGR